MSHRLKMLPSWHSYTKGTSINTVCNLVPAFILFFLGDQVTGVSHEMCFCLKNECHCSCDLTFWLRHTPFCKKSDNEKISSAKDYSFMRYGVSFVWLLLTVAECQVSCEKFYIQLQNVLCGIVDEQCCHSPSILTHCGKLRRGRTW